MPRFADFSIKGGGQLPPVVTFTGYVVNGYVLDGYVAG